MLAQEDGGLNAGHADEVVDDSFAVFHGGTGVMHVLLRDDAPADLALDNHMAESGAEQANLAGRVGEVHGLRDAVGVGAALHEVLGQREGGGVGAGVVEGAGVGEDGGVEAVGPSEW